MDNLEGPVLYREIVRPDPAWVAELARFDVSTLFDCNDDRGLLDPLTVRPVLQSVRICGPAVTASNAPGDNLAMHAALGLTRQGDVLLVAAGSDEPTPTWGGRAVEAALSRGMAGMVTDGYVRDIAYIREKEFPVWTRGATARHGVRKTIGGVNVPVVCGGVEVFPGDIIVADDDGVIAIRAADARAVLERAGAYMDRERSEIEALRKGSTMFAENNMQQILESAHVAIVDGAYPGGAGA